MYLHRCFHLRNSHDSNLPFHSNWSEVGVSRHIDTGGWSNDTFVNLVTDVALTLERDHILETRPGRDRDRRKRLTGVLVADVLNEEQDEDIVLVLARIHAAAEFIATRPEGGIEFRFLKGHSLMLVGVS